MPSSKISFPTTHPAFPGHFPGAPVVPGALLLAHAQRILEQEVALEITGVSEARFLAPVAPDSVVDFTWENGAGVVSFRMEVAEQLVARGKFLFRGG